MGVEVLYQVVEPEAFEVDARSISDAALTSIAVSLKRMADRAGAAASADRIKALEARVAELEEATHRMKYPRLRRRAANEADQ